MSDGHGRGSQQDRLRNYYLGYTGVFIALILVLALLERHGLPPRWIGYAFLFFTIIIYAAIGIIQPSM